MDSMSLESLGENIDTFFFFIGVAVLGIELARGVLNKTLKWRGVADMLASISTQIPFLIIDIFVLSFAYGFYTLVADRYIHWQFDIHWASILLAIIVVDFFYYWEHRFAHVVRVLWIHHAVHHSSRYMNIVTSVRFGSFEGIWSMIALFPMALMGFPPELIIFGSLVVLAYQIWIHTELIGKLGPIEWFFNTPSHHRVHHGCDRQYIDTNYGGILIIWDRFFGSFQAEEETPRYGLTRDFDSVNPLKVWFSELPQFLSDVAGVKNTAELRRQLFGPPSH